MFRSCRRFFGADRAGSGPGWRAVPTILLVGVVAACGVVGDLETVEANVREAFPEVEQLDTADLASWLAEPARAQPMLLDVREADEFAISHLAGARRVPPGDVVPPDVLDLDRSTPIVVYCSVGYRSSRFARALEAAGFDQVWNLEGSIFAWANEERPLVREDERPVSEVHPYDRSWGRLVLPEYRAALP